MTENDPNYCGLDPLTTGKYDPFWISGVCKAHDEAYNKLVAGHPDKTNLQTQLEFAGGVLQTALQGAYAVVAAPLYLVAGGMGGAVRWWYLESKAKSRINIEYQTYQKGKIVAQRADKEP